MKAKIFIQQKTRKIVKFRKFISVFFIHLLFHKKKKNKEKGKAHIAHYVQHHVHLFPVI